MLSGVCPQAVVSTKLVKPAAPGKGVLQSIRKSLSPKGKTPANHTQYKAPLSAADSQSSCT